MSTKVKQNSLLRKFKPKIYDLQGSESPKIDIFDIPKKECSLDTLAQLDTESDIRVKSKLSETEKTSKEKWQNQAKLKAISNNLSLRLIDVKDSKITKSVWNTYHCMEYISSQGGKPYVNRCKNRWCPSCQRVYAGKLMNGYRKSIKKMNNPYFLTLTKVSVKADELKPTIETMKLDYVNITRTLKTRCQRGGRWFEHNAIRKLESEYNYYKKTFNPHFHILIDGRSNAEMIRELWLERDTTLSPDAQKIVEADKESVDKELFKYVTKNVTRGKFSAEAQNTIYEAIQNKKIYQSYGNITFRKEDVTEHMSSLIDWKEDMPIYYSAKWEQKVYDWMGTDGEPLTDYIPTPDEQDIIHNLRLPKEDKKSKHKK